MNEKIKIIEIENRSFAIHKFDVKTATKVIKRLISKVMPVFDQALPTAGGADTVQNKIQVGNIGDMISFESISRALDKISDEDLDYVFDASLKHTSLVLSNGDHMQVMNDYGRYGVEGVEHDLVLVWRLVAEAVVLSVQGFTDVNRLTSILAPAFGSLASNASM